MVIFMIVQLGIYHSDCHSVVPVVGDIVLHQPE